MTNDKHSTESCFTVLGTPLQATTYADWIQRCHDLCRENRTTSIDFTNTQIVTLRRHDASFRRITRRVDYFIPDGMPLIWCLNRRGANLKDRVYGPTFMGKCIEASPAPWTHYFLGGSDDCLARLIENMKKRQPELKVAGMQNGYFKEEDNERIVDEINRAAPDFIWIGLGTPKQQQWIDRHRDRIQRGLLLAVGFAFDVNAGTKKDAPAWMQRLGITWLYRLASEPARLGPRYIKFNTLFIYYLLCERFSPGKIKE